MGSIVAQRKSPTPRHSIEAQASSSAERDTHRLALGVIWTAVLALLLLAIGLAVPDLRSVLSRVAHATLGWLALAVALEVASCLGYVAVLRLVMRVAPAREVRRLAWAEMAFGAVVPVGGAGSLAVGAWAMRAWGISWSRIANRSAVIFLLTTAVNAAVLALAGFGVLLGIGTHKAGLVYGGVPALAAIAGVVLFVILPYLPESRSGWLGLVVRRTSNWVRDTETVALRPSWRLLGAVGYLLFDIAVLWACFRAVGTQPPVLALVVGYQIGYLANLIPIPGGVGVLEGGLLGALLLYGLPAAPTAAAVVLYHAIALWVPTLGGTVGFARLRRAVVRAEEPLAWVASERQSNADVGPARPAAAQAPAAADASRSELAA